MWVLNMLRLLMMAFGLASDPAAAGPCWAYSAELGARFGIADDPAVMPACPYLVPP